MLIVSILLFQIIQSSEIIPPSDVHKGMEGIGLSTFEGSKIDTFQVKIIGKLPPSPTGSEVILAKLKGDVIDKSGILAGMSGSPVYINGKLLGAVAYAWGFSKEPICGIMPFTEMKRGGSLSLSGSSGLTLIKPILNVSGFPSSSIPFLDSLPGDFFISQSNLGGMTDETTPFLPGGVCGVTLLTGDGNISIMGIISEVIGDTVYAFGHPAYGTGGSNLPLCGGKVCAYLPSYYQSFEFINPGKIVGTITSDRTSGLKGIIGKDPPMVNCRIRVGSLEKKYRITAQESLLPALTSLLVFSNWVEEMGLYKPSTLRGKLTLWTNHGPLSVFPVMSGEALQDGLYRRTREILAEIQDNRYKGVTVDSIHIFVSSEPQIRRYRIKDLKLEKRKFKLGEKITARITIDQYRKSDTSLCFTFQAPTKPCELLIRVSGREEFIYFEQGRAPLNFQFNDFSEWKKFINTLPVGDQFIFSVYKKGSSLSTEVGELKNLPSSIQLVLGKKDGWVSNNLFLIEKKKIVTDGPVVGEVRKSIEIRR